MNAQCHACIGGTVVREDMRKLEGGVHIVVGTPGRVYDMINRRALGMLLNRLQCLQNLVHGMFVSNPVGHKVPVDS